MHQPDPQSPNPSSPPASPGSTSRKLITALVAACALLVLVDLAFWITGYDKHSYFKWESWPGFYALYGFVACTLLVLTAKHILRPLVMRDENHYSPPKKSP